MEKIEYIPEGTCSKKISIILEDDRITQLDLNGAAPETFWA